MARLRYNGLGAALGADLAAGDTTITFAAPLTHSGGTAVPTISGSDYIPLALLDDTGALREIVNLTAYTSGATTGTVTRAQEGTAAAAHVTTGRAVNAVTTTDVADFVTSDSGWQVVGDTGMPGFENGWSNYGSGEDVAAYRKINGVVYLRGTIKSGTLGSAAFTLPVGYRPTALPGVTNSALYPILSNDAIGKLLIVPTTGAVAPTAPASNIYASLAGVEFPAATS